MENKNFVHLHVHSDQSLLDGYGTAEQYLKYASELGFNSIACTDHGNVDGSIDWQKECEKNNIKSIIGCEFYIVQNMLNRPGKKEKEKRDHITALVKNEVGWNNILRLLTIANLQGFYYRPRIDPEILLEYIEGLVILTGCSSSPIMTSWGLDLFGNMIKNNVPVFLEVMPHNLEEQKEVNKACLEFQKMYPKIKLCATNDCHYVKKEHSEIHEVMLAIQSKAKWNDKNRWKFETDGLFLKTADQMFLDFKAQNILNDFAIEEAIESTLEVSSLCNFKISKVKVSLPKVELSVYKKLSEEDQLINLCADGLTEKIKNDPSIDISIYEKRIEYEIGQIFNLGFTRYFLIVYELVQWCKKNDIMTGPRGSSGGSLVVYLLGITPIDPIKYNLIFSRFISPDRIDLPDIDIDFEDIKRDRVRGHLEEVYGKNNVSGISTFSIMHSKQALRDVSRVFDIPLDEVNAASKSLFFEESDEEDNGLTLKNFFQKVPEAKLFYKKYPKVSDIAIAIEGRKRNAGRHAAGVCVSSNDLRNGKNANLVMRGREVLCCNWGKENAEFMGLMKLDILGLSALTVLNDTRKLIKKRHGKEIVYENIIPNDKRVLEQFTQGNNTAVFQFSGYGMINLCKNIKVDRFESLIDINALYRPGTLRSGLVETYIKRKTGVEKYTFQNKIIAEVTKNSYGIVLYQEQVLELLVRLAGFDWKEADKVRKIIGKSKGIQEFNVFEDKFINGCIKNKALGKEQAKSFFDDLKYFSEYSFNKSHSTAYSLVAYWQQWLKVYYPIEFFNVSLTHCGESQIDNIIKEALKIGVKINLPDINDSDDTNYIINGNNEIVAPLISVKGVGPVSSFAIINERKNGLYKNEQDFINRLVKKKVSAKTIGILKGLGSITKGDKIKKDAQNLISFNLSNEEKLFSNLAVINSDEKLSGYKNLCKSISACKLCSLSKECNSPVLPSFGKFNIMIIREPPWKDEDRIGKCFVGKTGKDILWPELSKYNLSREDFYITNVVKCYASVSKKPNQEQIFICVEYLKKEIEIIKPFIILAFGNTNSLFFLKKESGITKINGETYWSKEYNSWICWSIHPTSTLYNPDNKILFSGAIENFVNKIFKFGFSE